MKKLSLLVVLSLALTAAVNAQEYKKFKVGIGGGYARPGGEGAKGGILFYVEPAYRITDVISVGLRMESAVIVRGYSDPVAAEFDLDIAGIGSYTVNGQYYFSNNNFRPFVGVGLGLFSLAAVEYDIDGTTEVAAKAEKKIGFYPRVGFDAGHFTLSLDYNIIPATEAGDGEFKNSYLGVRIGGFFGGGKK
jgi:hypothetical protein